MLAIMTAALAATVMVAVPVQARSPSPNPSPAPALSARGEAQDDLFRLTIETPGTTFTVGEAIPITTTLTYVSTAPTVTVAHAFGGIVAFGIEQLDGPLDADPFRRMSCEHATVSAGDVQSVPFHKSGAYDTEGPLAPLFRTWLHDPLVRPPAGTHRIDAVAEYGAAGCGNETTLTASVTIEVVDVESSPDSSPVVVDIPTSLPAPSGQMVVCATAQLFGVLVSDGRWGVAIVSDADGRTVKVIWPNAWSARRDSTGLALVDATGTVIAHEADHVELGGGEDTDGHWHTCGDPGLVLLP